MTKTLYILRGLPSSGKTTLAKILEQSLPNCVAIAADDYFYNEDGNYKWHGDKVGDAHRWCQNLVDDGMSSGVINIVVHNTSTSEKELKPYLDIAKIYGYKITSLIVENRHSNKNNHNVPDDVVDKMEQRLRNSIKLK